MLDLLTGFVGELRAAGLPVSTVEAIDAATALCHTDLTSRPAVRTALAATLVKSARYMDAFDLAFDVYFGSRPPEPGSAAEAALEAADLAAIAAALGGWAEGDGDPALLAEALFLALESGDRALLEAVARRAVRLLSGMEAGRPLGAAYYLYRVMRQLNAPHVRRRLGEAAAGTDALARRLEAEEMARRFEEFRRVVEAEILRRLVADRGPEAVARVLRRPLVEDADLTAATTAELAEIERALHPLARRLAVRLSRRRRGGSGRLDVRRTLRAALSSGGVPARPALRKPHRSKPDIVLLCDVSGSVATFARFTLQIVLRAGRPVRPGSVVRLRRRPRRGHRVLRAGRGLCRRRQAHGGGGAGGVAGRAVRLRAGLRPVRRGLLGPARPADDGDRHRGRPQQLPEPQPGGLTSHRPELAAPCSGSTPSGAGRGTPATRSWPPTGASATACTRCAPCASWPPSSSRWLFPAPAAYAEPAEAARPAAVCRSRP